MSLSLLIIIPIIGYFVNKRIIKESPKKVGFSMSGIHFKYVDREITIKWESIKNIKKDFTYPLMAYKIYQKNNQKVDLAMCDKDIIYEIRNQLKDKWKAKLN